MTLMCLVDGCGADLSDCRKYYQRHKVCEIHSKTPQVSINGQLLRFCQQCSRFHSLEEFDDGKRSCRKRLDGHNKRRRKPRPPSLFSPNNGTDTLRSSGQQLLVHPTMAHANRLWGGVAEAQTQAQALSWVDQSNGAPSLLSSYAAPPQAYTLSHVVHPPSDSGSFPMTATPLDEGPSYGVNLYRGVTDMDPHHHAAYVDDDQDPLKLPFYWGS